MNALTKTKSSEQQQAPDLPLDPATPANLVVRSLDWGAASSVEPLSEPHWLQTAGTAVRKNLLELALLALPLLVAGSYYFLS